MVTRRRRFVALFIVLAFFLASCGESDSTPVSATQLDDSYKPADSLEAALDEMLGAMQENDANASFSLLTPGSRAEYGDAADWAERMRELPPITDFEVQDRQDTTLQALVNHEPGLSPFVGLSAAQERQTWTGERFDKGWLLQADPQVEPILPDESKAGEAAADWFRAVQACNQDTARGLQGVTTLFASVTPTICGVDGEVVFGAVERLSEGPASTDIVAQYTADALSWARVVPVTSPLSVKVIMAPIGDDWKVIGLA